MVNAAIELCNIRLAIEKQNAIIQNMLNVMQKPENKFVRALQMLLLIIGVLGITSVIDVVRNWVLGG